MLMALLLVVSSLCGCGASKRTGDDVDSDADSDADSDTDSDADTDTDTDTDTETGTGTGTDTDTETDTGTDTETDTGTDTGTDTDTGSDPDACDPVLDPDPPECSEVGDPCGAGGCELGLFCATAGSGWPDGYCLAGGPVGAGACDVELPASCPEGSSCVSGGVDDDGIARFYCYKDCNIGEKDVCGCRDQYTCVFADAACWDRSQSDGGRGVCIPDCVNNPDPDAFCRDHWGDAPNCDLGTGMCEP